MTLSKQNPRLLLFEQAYAAATRGKGAVLLISGPVGAGKTALTQEIAAQASRRGGLCFMVTASAGNGSTRSGCWPGWWNRCAWPACRRPSRTQIRTGATTRMR
ncbi:hypothetical protein GCM10027605_55450 [Micromonospora zhanjiangensis]